MKGNKTEPFKLLYAQFLANRHMPSSSLSTWRKQKLGADLFVLEV